MAFSVFAAAQPELTLVPLSDPLLEVSSGEVREVQYMLMNRSDKEHILSMKPMKGVIQQTGKSGFCENHMHMKPGQSCLLALATDGENAINLDRAGPLLCENAWNWYDEDALATEVCVQPAPQERLSIQVVPQGMASLSVAITNPRPQAIGKLSDLVGRKCFPSFATCPLILFQGTGTVGHLEIRNTSTTITIFNLQASNLPPGVTPDGSACVVLAPGATCLFEFLPGNSKSQGTVITVSGLHARPIQVQVDVLGIGDPFGGGFLFVLPTAANNYDITVAATADASTTPITWNVADTTCNALGSNWSLPTIGELRRLYQNSSCVVDGVIGSFTCGSVYWSSDASTFNAQGLNFSTGVSAFRAKDNPARARCIGSYLLE